MIGESDVSILIPSYKRLDMTVKAIESALATGAGEVIVSEDFPGTDMSPLSRFTDTRLKLVKQPVNLGLWKNHLYLIRAASKPWLKFLQMDDWITEDCLTRMCAAVTPTTAMVNGLSMYMNLETKAVYKDEVIAEPYTWTPQQYLQRLLVVGNELGRPSNSLVKTSAIDISEEAWDNDKSCDLIMNVMAVKNGDTTILPEGLIYIGVHANQDTFLQSYQLIISRLRNSLAYLKAKNVKEINTFVNVYGFVELLGMVRIMLANIRKGKSFYYKGLMSDMMFMLRTINARHLWKNRKLVSKYYRCKFRKEKDIVTILH